MLFQAKSTSEKTSAVLFCFYTSRRFLAEHNWSRMLTYSKACLQICQNQGEPNLAKKTGKLIWYNVYSISSVCNQQKLLLCFVAVSLFIRWCCFWLYCISTVWFSHGWNRQGDQTVAGVFSVWDCHRLYVQRHAAHTINTKTGTGAELFWGLKLGWARYSQKSQLKAMFPGSYIGSWCQFSAS